ncbi:tyrosine-type recombinase/integrase, partial [bacterium]|nr:tyrosine-type recombinase/integrase [bacterium]
MYTQRNYRQALGEFAQWHRDTSESPVCWSELERNDFRLFLRQLGRRKLSQAAIRLRFSALNSFYKFLMRRGLVESSPVKDVTLPKPAKRLPQFLTIDQMNALLDAPMQEFEAERVAKKVTKKKVSAVPYLRDRAILETIYSCGLRIGEICRMLAGEIEPDEHVVKVHGKGKKERQVPIGRAAVEAIRLYWERLAKPPALDEHVFFASEKKRSAIYPRLVQLRLKNYLSACGLDPSLTPHKLRHSY